MRNKKISKHEIKEEQQKTYEPNLSIIELQISKKLMSELTQKELENKVKDTRNMIMSYIGMNISRIKITTKEALEGNAFRLMIRKAEIFTKKIKKAELENALSEIQNTIILETRRHFSKMITRQDVVDLIEEVGKNQPMLIEELKNRYTYSMIHRVIKELLDDKIRLNNIYTILEVMSDTAEYTANTDVVVENVRMALARNITQGLMNKEDNKIHIITLEGTTENMLVQREKNSTSEVILNVEEIKELAEKINKEIKKANEKNMLSPIMVVDASIRKKINTIVNMLNMEISVLSINELDPSIDYKIEASISIQLPEIKKQA